MNKQKSQGFSVLITSLSFDDREVIKQLNLPEGITYPLPNSAKFILWQAFHTDLKKVGKNSAACLKYVEDKSAFLAEKYAHILNDKKQGYVFQSGSSDFILRDICLPLLSGVDEDKVFELFKPVLDTIDYVVFIDKRLSSKAVQGSSCILGKENIQRIRLKMLDLAQKRGWKVISLQKRKFNDEDLNEIKSFCKLI